MVINERKLLSGILNMVYAVDCPYCKAEPLMRCADARRVLGGNVHWARYDRATKVADEMFADRQMDSLSLRMGWE